MERDFYGPDVLHPTISVKALKGTQNTKSIFLFDTKSAKNSKKAKQIIIIIIQTFVTRAVSANILNLRRIFCSKVK